MCTLAAVALAGGGVAETTGFAAFWERFRTAVERSDSGAIRAMTRLPILFEGEPHDQARFARVYDALFDAPARRCLAAASPREENGRFSAFCGHTIFVFARDGGEWRFAEFAADAEAGDAEESAPAAGAAVESE